MRNPKLELPDVEQYVNNITVICWFFGVTFVISIVALILIAAARKKYLDTPAKWYLLPVLAIVLGGIGAADSASNEHANLESARFSSEHLVEGYVREELDLFPDDDVSATMKDRGRLAYKHDYYVSVRTTDGLESFDVVVNPDGTTGIESVWDNHEATKNATTELPTLDTSDAHKVVDPDGNTASFYLFDVIRDGETYTCTADAYTKAVTSCAPTN